MGTPVLDKLLSLGVIIVIASYLPVWLLSFCIVLVIGLSYKRWAFRTLANSGAPGPTPVPVLGTLLPVLVKGVRRADVDLIKKNGKLVSTWEGSTPAVIVADPDVLREVCIKRFQHFTNRRSGGLDEYPVRRALTRLQGARWKQVRSSLNTSFTSAKLRQVLKGINQSSEGLVKRLDTLAGQRSGVVDFKRISGEFAMEVIMRTAFRLDPQEYPGGTDEFLRHAEKVFSFSWQRSLISLVLLLPFSHQILKLLRVHLFPKESSSFFLDVIGDAVAQHVANSQGPPSFLQFMLEVLESNHNADDKRLTPEEIEAQCLLFFIAGFETTASTLAFLAYCLATHPECQEKLVQEISALDKENRSISSEQLSELPYLDMCVQETLRMYPPVVRVNRVCSSDVDLGSVRIPKGSLVIIPIYAIHHHPDFWPNPEKFDPNRFTATAKSERDPLVHIPFGAGPRHCIGSRLSLLEIKVALVQLLHHFVLEPSTTTQVPLKLKSSGTLQFEKGIHLKVSRRRPSRNCTNNCT